MRFVRDYTRTVEGPSGTGKQVEMEMSYCIQYCTIVIHCSESHHPDGTVNSLGVKHTVRHCSTILCGDRFLLLAARLPYPPERTVVRVVDALVKLAGPLPRCSVCEHSHTTACCGHIAAAPLQLSREESTAGVCVARVRVSTARLPAEQI